MDTNITYNSIVFTKSYDNETGSRRQSNARSVSTPDVFSIKHMDTVDSETKTPNRRHTLRFDQYNVDADGVVFKNDAYLVIDVSAKSSTAQVNSLVATVRAAIAETTAGKDMIAGAVNNES